MSKYFQVLRKPCGIKDTPGRYTDQYTQLLEDLDGGVPVYVEKDSGHSYYVVNCKYRQSYVELIPEKYHLIPLKEKPV